MSKSTRKFSIKWKSSKKPKKQKKYRLNAPLHIKRKFVHAHLSKELMKKYKKRSVGIRTGDKVMIMRGAFKKREGKVEEVELKRTKIYISGVEVTKKDGTKAKIPIEPSNLMITELNTDDKIRQKIIERK